MNKPSILCEAIAKLPMDDLIKILAATLTGMDVDEFKVEAEQCSQPPRTRAGAGPIPILRTGRWRRS